MVDRDSDSVCVSLDGVPMRHSGGSGWDLYEGQLALRSMPCDCDGNYNFARADRIAVWFSGCRGVCDFVLLRLWNVQAYK